MNERNLKAGARVEIVIREMYYPYKTLLKLAGERGTLLEYTPLQKNGKGGLGYVALDKKPNQPLDFHYSFLKAV